jgi:F-type H+-transporting ATPase subunit alpha
MAILNKGAKNVEILKQGQYAPVPVEKQIAIIYCGTMGLLKDIPIDKVKEFEKEFLEYLELNKKKLLNELAKGIITDNITTELETVASELTLKYKPGQQED